MRLCRPRLRTTDSRRVSRAVEVNAAPQHRYHLQSTTVYSQQSTEHTVTNSPKSITLLRLTAYGSSLHAKRLFLFLSRSLFPSSQVVQSCIPVRFVLPVKHCVGSVGWFGSAFSWPIPAVEAPPSERLALVPEKPNSPRSAISLWRGGRTTVTSAYSLPALLLYTYLLLFLRRLFFIVSAMYVMLVVKVYDYFATAMHQNRTKRDRYCIKGSVEIVENDFDRQIFVLPH